MTATTQAMFAATGPAVATKPERPSWAAISAVIEPDDTAGQAT